MFKSDFDQIIREHFDLSDDYTRKYIVAMEDAQQDQLISALSVALYEKIVAKVDEIDFGTIPMSRGDITKVEGFAGTEQCLDIIRQLVLEYKQDTSIVDVVLTAIQNVKDRKHIFVKAYALNAEFPMLIYNLITLSIIRSTSLMVATCVEYIKDPTSPSMKKALNKAAYKKTMDDMMFRQLISFNNLCKNKSLDKALESSCKAVRESVAHGFEDSKFAPLGVEDCPVEPCDPFGVDEPQNIHNVMKQSGVAPEIDPMAGAHVEDKPEEQEAPVENDDDREIGIDIEDDVEPENIPDSDGVADGGNFDAIDEEDEEIEEASLSSVMGAIEKGLTNANLSNNKIGAAIIKYNNLPDSEKKKLNSSIGSKVLLVGVILTLPYLTIKVIIPLIRNIIYNFYYAKMKFSDYLEVQADLIEANANELQYSDSGLDEDQKQKVIKKQLKVAEKFRKWSNIFSIDKKQSENNANKAISEDEKDKKRVGKDGDGEDVLF